jgi:citrate lyase subunit beta/citryl-CoA lyase
MNKPDKTPRERWRSLLYTPADRPERYVKAWTEGAADIVCADLEDAVAPDKKAAARKAVAEALAGPRAATWRAVRINAPGTAAQRHDIDAVARAGADFLVVPKVEDVAQVTDVARSLTGDTRIIAIVETAKGVVHAREIAQAGGRLAAICFGAEDLAADMGMRRSPEAHEVQTARQWVLLCARAAGLPALDMITPDYRDVARVTRDARQARDWGFAGKMCIHPAQVEAVHAAYAPTSEEAAWARKVVAAGRSSHVMDGGVVVVDGTMVDVPVLRQAERVLALLEAD